MYFLAKIDLSREYEELAAQLYQSAVTSSMQSKRKTLGEFQVNASTFRYKLDFKIERTCNVGP